jgi:hypothetical protein
LTRVVAHIEYARQETWCRVPSEYDTRLNGPELRTTGRRFRFTRVLVLAPGTLHSPRAEPTENQQWCGDVNVDAGKVKAAELRS